MGTSGQAGLAQLVEHLICNQGVTGSSPVVGTNNFKGLHLVLNLICEFMLVTVSVR